MSIPAWLFVNAGCAPPDGWVSTQEGGVGNLGLLWRQSVNVDAEKLTLRFLLISPHGPKVVCSSVFSARALLHCMQNTTPTPRRLARHHPTLFFLGFRADALNSPPSAAPSGPAGCALLDKSQQPTGDEQHHVPRAEPEASFFGGGLACQAFKDKTIADLLV